MDEAERRVLKVRQLVQVVQRSEHLADDEEPVREEIGLTEAVAEAAEGLSVEELHHDAVDAGRALDDLVRLDDVRVIEPRGDARLLEEHAPELVLLREVRAHLLDDDELLEALRALQGRQVHGGHSASAELDEAAKLRR